MTVMDEKKKLKLFLDLFIMVPLLTLLMGANRCTSLALRAICFPISMHAVAIALQSCRQGVTIADFSLSLY